MEPARVYRSVLISVTNPKVAVALAKVSNPRGSVLRRPYGAYRLNSNAPFAAEVQSNIEQSCCYHTHVRFRGKSGLGTGQTACRLLTETVWKPASRL